MKIKKLIKKILVYILLYINTILFIIWSFSRITVYK